MRPLRITKHALDRYVERVRPDLTHNRAAAMARLLDAAAVAQPNKPLADGHEEWRVPRALAPGATRRERDRNRLRLRVDVQRGAVETVLGAYDKGRSC